MRSLGLFLAVSILTLFAGCEAGNSPAGDAQKTNDQIKQEAQALSAGDLEKVVSRYNEEIAKLMAKIKELEKKGRELTSKDFLGEEGQKAIEGTRELLAELKKLKDRLTIYNDELASRK